MGGCWWMFPATTLPQPNYSYGCFLDGVVVVVAVTILWSKEFIHFPDLPEFSLLIPNNKSGNEPIM